MLQKTIYRDQQVEHEGLVHTADVECAIRNCKVEIDGKSHRVYRVKGEDYWSTNLNIILARRDTAD